jgi:peptidylprolyl isomerase
VEAKEEAMIKAQIGYLVKVHFTGKLDDGTVFATSKGSKPVNFRVGTGEVISGLENAVVGMSPGESKTAIIPPEEAFGHHRGDRWIIVARSEFPKHIEPRKGQLLRVRKNGDKTGMLRVVLVDDVRVVLDTNHVLAGKKITMDIELLECSEPPEPCPQVTDVEKRETITHRKDKRGAVRSRGTREGESVERPKTRASDHNFRLLG